MGRGKTEGFYTTGLKSSTDKKERIDPPHLMSRGELKIMTDKAVEKYQEAYDSKPRTHDMGYFDADRKTKECREAVAALNWERILLEENLEENEEDVRRLQTKLVQNCNVWGLVLLLLGVLLLSPCTSYVLVLYFPQKHDAYNFSFVLGQECNGVDDPSRDPTTNMFLIPSVEPPDDRRRRLLEEPTREDREAELEVELAAHTKHEHELEVELKALKKQLKSTLPSAAPEQTEEPPPTHDATRRKLASYCTNSGCSYSGDGE
jgi:hypothetical protein